MAMLRRMITILLTIVLLWGAAALPAAASGAEEPCFQGYVLDAQGNGIENVAVTVRLDDTEKTLVMKVKTNASGQWELPGLKYNQAYQVSFSHADYRFTPFRLIVLEADPSAVETLCLPVLGAPAASEPEDSPSETPAQSPPPSEAEILPTEDPDAAQPPAAEEDTPTASEGEPEGAQPTEAPITEDNNPAETQVPADTPPPGATDTPAATPTETGTPLPSEEAELSAETEPPQPSEEAELPAETEPPQPTDEAAADETGLAATPTPTVAPPPETPADDAPTPETPAPTEAPAETEAPQSTEEAAADATPGVTQAPVDAAPTPDALDGTPAPAGAEPELPAAPTTAPSETPAATDAAQLPEAAEDWVLTADTWEQRTEAYLALYETADDAALLAARDRIQSHAVNRDLFITSGVELNADLLSRFQALADRLEALLPAVSPTAEPEESAESPDATLPTEESTESPDATLPPEESAESPDTTLPPEESVESPDATPPPEAAEDWVLTADKWEQRTEAYLALYETADDAALLAARDRIQSHAVNRDLFITSGVELSADLLSRFQAVEGRLAALLEAASGDPAQDEQDEEAPHTFSGDVTIHIQPQFAQINETVTLTAEISSDIQSDRLRYQWQWAKIPQTTVDRLQAADPQEEPGLVIREENAGALSWTDEPGATESSYRFTGTDETLNRFWRIVITVAEDPAPDAAAEAPAAPADTADQQTGEAVADPANDIIPEPTAESN